MRFWIVVAAISAAACGNADTARVKATSRGAYDPSTGKLVEITYDRNKNGVIDTWVHMNGTQPICADIDTNEDGVVDRWEYYGEQGQLVRVGWLRNKPADAPPSRHGGAAMPIGPAGSDPCAPAQGEAGPDAWAYFGPDGKIARIEYLAISPTTGQRIVGRREFYEQGQLVRAEDDTDGDGLVDHWETWVNGRLSQAEFDDTASTAVVLDANGTPHLQNRGPRAGKPTRRLTYDASGKVILIETDPDASGNFTKKTIPK